MFGVYAAAERQIGVNGTVSFVAENVKATITVYQAYSSGLTPSESNDVDTFSFTLANQTPSADIVLGEIVGEEPSELIHMSDAVLTYTYVVTISNDFDENGSGIQVDYTVPSTAYAWLELKSATADYTTGAIAKPVTTLSGSGLTVDIAAGDTQSWIFVYTITPELAPQSITFDVDSAYTLTRIQPVA